MVPLVAKKEVKGKMDQTKNTKSRRNITKNTRNQEEGKIGEERTMADLQMITNRKNG